MNDVRRADEAIDRYGVLQGAGERDLQALVDLAALVCEVPRAAINLITRDHQHQVAATGIDPSVCSREDSMCAAVLDDVRTVVAVDASADPRFAANPFVTGEIDAVRFYASAPLTTPDGTTIGRLCVFDSEPHQLAQERADVLHVVAERVVDVLELRLRSRQLEQSLEELTRTEAELTRSNELLSVFAGQVSHDLRSPLTAVLANTEMLASEPVVNEHPEVAAMVRATALAGERMNAMIETMLSYARVGADLRRRSVHLDRVLDHVLADLAPALEQRDAEVRRDPLPEVVADEDHLYAVLLNLVSNAVKFTPAGRRPQIEVTASTQDGAHRIAVSDNGSGIAPESREVVFGLGARVNHFVAGTGIGLATAKRAVEAHGGRIGITDNDAGGTTIWFTLPA